MRPAVLASPSPAAHPIPGRSIASCLAAWLLVFAASSAQAIALGDVSAQSELGRPFRALVPVTAQPNENLSGECFRLAPNGLRIEGIPELQAGRVALERIGALTQLVVSSTRPINDPLLRLTLQAGCEAPIRREYVLLLDPVAITTPMAGTFAVGSRFETDAQNSGGVVDRNNNDNTASPPNANLWNRVTGASNTRGAAAIARARQGGTVANASASRTASNAQQDGRTPEPGSAASLQPRLSVSNSAPGMAGGRGISAQEVANALEAETLVLRQRVAQLTDTILRLDLEIRKAQAAHAARVVDEAAKSTQAVAGAWWNGSWTVFAAVFGLAALIAAGLGWKRRHASPQVATWPAANTVQATLESPASTSAASDAEAAPQPTGKRPTALRAVSLEPVTPRPTPLRFGPKQDSASLAVSEVSHVTEEAGVYIAFNKIGRAIDVLREHIRMQPRSLPAAWMMLLDLYRNCGREPEFHQLAQEFHQQFNAQAPKWDTYPDRNKEDGGLEAIPRVMDQIVSLWGTPQCREYLELLLHDNRDGRRIGFSPNTYEEILLLRQMCDGALAAESATPAEASKLRPAWAAPASQPAPARIIAAVAAAKQQSAVAVGEDIRSAAAKSAPRLVVASRGQVKAANG